MLSRRDLVGKLAAGTAAVCVVGVARTSLASTRNEPAGPGAGNDAASNGRTDPLSTVVDAGPSAALSTPPRWELLHPLAMGSAVAHGWRVAGLTGAVDGSCVLTLQNERGRAHRVHICRNAGDPQGLVYTRQFDLVVMNGGEGDLPTDEGLAQAVAEVAHVLATNESDHQPAAVVTALLPHAERVRLFAGSEGRRLR